jgi:hypothetical protein
MDKLLATLDKVKTPLTLAGLVVIVLYGLYSQLLRTNVLTPLSGDSTFIIVRDFIRYIFWLAIVAVVLGIVSYVVVQLRPPHKDPGAAVELKSRTVRRKSNAGKR